MPTETRFDLKMFGSQLPYEPKRVSWFCNHYRCGAYGRESSWEKAGEVAADHANTEHPGWNP